MTSKTSPQAHDSSSLDRTELSERSMAIIQLGKKLVQEFELNNSADTLGRWMAHYIAELIYDTENASDNNIQSAKRTELRDTILAFWAHRYALPTGNKPFHELEPILRTLKNLDPESQQGRYFSHLYRSSNSEEESEKIKQWLEMAEGIDYTSKILIEYCLSLAVENAIDKSQEWIELAQKAELVEDTTFIELQLAQLVGSPTRAKTRMKLKGRHLK